eukprot:CAMPEP_0180679436 /NCGR_PEP_ID=MMETSP1037_2-20121125/68923_1 /TAXON_ID=632150 /ORGANISM="Azadinium spinosum, Strain 3D9" /LENGTH=47 /DNA_ID= /DNA_START= /DNA_END= /DNA_ORIENTATION=
MAITLAHMASQTALATLDNSVDLNSVIAKVRDWCEAQLSDMPEAIPD